jgi:hypothetical protein
MPSLKSEAQAVRRQLERVLESPGFSRNERLSRFLRFVVEGHLDGKDHELKESVVAIEVFGRRPDFDHRLDPVVRTEAVRLRARLSEYYTKAGKTDALVIELPKGGYVPRFREVEEERQATAPIPAAGLGPMLVHAPPFCWAISRNGERNIPITVVCNVRSMACM